MLAAPSYGPACSLYLPAGANCCVPGTHAGDAPPMHPLGPGDTDDVSPGDTAVSPGDKVLGARRDKTNRRRPAHLTIEQAYACVSLGTYRKIGERKGRISYYKKPARAPYDVPGLAWGFPAGQGLPSVIRTNLCVRHKSPGRAPQAGVGVCGRGFASWDALP